MHVRANVEVRVGKLDFGVDKRNAVDNGQGKALFNMLVKLRKKKRLRKGGEWRVRVGGEERERGKTMR